MNDIDSIVKDDDAFILNTGSPHYVLFCNNISSIDVMRRGSEIRYSKKYTQEGINVNFVQFDNEIKMRTYERGVEDETDSCGTGAVAVALSAHKSKLVKESPILINTKGGDLIIDFEINKNQYTNVWLSGSVELIYSGEFVC